MNLKIVYFLELVLRRLCDEHGAWLLVDDAHGIGVCGPEGRGSAAAAGIQADILVVTFGKAVGVAGAAVLCRHSTAEYLLQFARHLIYSTAMPPAQALALHEALHQVAKADAARAQLQANIHDFRQRFVSGSLGLLPSHTPIQPLLCGDNDAVLAAAAALQAQGLWVGAIRPPTVPIGQGRLRITLSALHQSEHISALLAALERIA
jgi:8-amino-7-oxononanoate synthase